jgi:hypothetical protein
MGNYEQFIKKEPRPYIECLRDDIAARRNPDFFWPSGTQVYCGRQGSGKTLSLVRHLLKIRARYPKAVIVSNLELKGYTRIQFDSVETCKEAVKRCLESNHKAYLGFDNMEQLAIALTNVNNGFYGVVYVVDEIHTYFNALESKNIPMYVFTEISQQRKQRKLILGSSQLFMRMAKPLREQCDNLIVCSTMLGIITKQAVYDGMSMTQDYDGGLSGTVKKKGFFFHTRSIREAYDTYQKVVSGAEQYEEVARPLELVQSKRHRISLAR